MYYSGHAYSFCFAKKMKALDTVREENDNILESINDFKVI